jgi:hypothetical protein
MLNEVIFIEKTGNSLFILDLGGFLAMPASSCREKSSGLQKKMIIVALLRLHRWRLEEERFGRNQGSRWDWSLSVLITMLYPTASRGELTVGRSQPRLEIRRKAGLWVLLVLQGTATQTGRLCWRPLGT